MSTTPKTPYEYRKKPNHCPYCDSDVIEGSSVEIEGSAAYQQVSCNDCDRVWLDQYELICYEPVADPVIHAGIHGEPQRHD